MFLEIEFLNDEVNIEDPVSNAEEGQQVRKYVTTGGYAEAFGAQWLAHRETQLDSFSGITLSRDRLKRCLGDELWNTLGSSLVLEAGCGAGRFTEILLQNNAELVSVDLSEAVQANVKNFPQSESHLVIQADITDLPFALKQFDIVVALGVIQHTPSPEYTIEKLYEQVQEGGSIIFDHYAHTLSFYTKTTGVFRLLWKRLNPEKGMRYTRKLVQLLLPLHRSVRRFKFLQSILSRLSPVVTFYQAFPQFSEEQQFDWALLDTHDTLTDWYKHHRTVEQLAKIMSDLGAEDIHCRRGRYVIEVTAKKPSSK